MVANCAMVNSDAEQQYCGEQAAGHRILWRGMHTRFATCRGKNITVGFLYEY